jgi:transposase InsO family protein
MERHGLSQRHACRLVGMDRSTLRYQGTRPDDGALRQRLRELAAERRRFGYRRLGWMLAREGHAMNHKRLYRLYHEEKLMVRRRGRRKRAMGTRTPLLVPHAINQRWSLDFVSDTLSDGRRFRILCVVDDFSRECLATVVDTSLGGVRVVRELERLTTERAVPQEVVSDNGTELTSGAVLRWATGRLAWHYIEPGQADPERPHRELQQPLAGGMSERTRLRLARRRAPQDRTVANRIQSGAAALEPGLSDARRVRGKGSDELGHRAHRLASKTSAGRRGARRSDLGSKL